MWVDCPKCGKSKAAWEDSSVTTFCGACEQEYRLWLEEQEAARPKRPRDGEDWGE